MKENNKFTTFTYKENRDKPKHSSLQENAIIPGKEEKLISIDEEFAYKLNKDSFKDDSARQNAWIREFIKFDKLSKREKTDEEIVAEIEVAIGDYVVRGEGYEVKRGEGINRNTGIIRRGNQEWGIGSGRYRCIRDNAVNSRGDEIFRKLETGVVSAFYFARYYIKEAEKENKPETDVIQNGDRLYMNDTLDAANKIDFVGISKDKDEYLDRINLIQVKSSRPSPEEIESIQNAHKEYFKKIQEISELELKKIIKLNYEKEHSILDEEYGERLRDLMFYLMEIGQIEKEKDPNGVIEKIVQDAKKQLSFSEQGITFLSSMIMYSRENFYKIIEGMCGGKIDFLDVEIFMDWINSKVKKSPLQEYLRNNIVSGRKYKSVISYKGSYGWVNLEEDLTN